MGFLLLMNRMVDPRGDRWAGWVLLLTPGGFAGNFGLAFHVEPIFEATRAGLSEKILYGAPAFAPLLFPNLALLGTLGRWDLEAKRTGR